MAIETGPGPVDTTLLRLTTFDPDYAAMVASWARGPLETYWLAPRTPPPLTGPKVSAWAGVGHCPLMLVNPHNPVPLAYGELNILRGKRNEFWLGHLIVDPWHRGRGLGRQLTQMLLLRAFQWQKARQVSLVVFPDNLAAIAGYRSAGMREDGYEVHNFEVYAKSERLLRFIATNLNTTDATAARP